MPVSVSTIDGLAELGHQPFGAQGSLLKKLGTCIEALVSRPRLEVSIKLEIKQDDLFA
jgi:hypothetical protein